MFSEPQTVTINAVAKALPRIAFGDRKGVFEDALGNRLTISHTFGRRNRHNARLDITKTAADPLLDGVSRQYSMSVQLIVDYPPVGFDNSERAINAQALVDYLDGAGILTKVVGGES
jgi:hypothetical protein